MQLRLNPGNFFRFLLLATVLVTSVLATTVEAQFGDFAATPMPQPAMEPSMPHGLVINLPPSFGGKTASLNFDVETSIPYECSLEYSEEALTAPPRSGRPGLFYTTPVLLNGKPNMGGGKFNGYDVVTCGVTYFEGSNLAPTGKDRHRQHVFVSLCDLRPGTTYHYRLLLEGKGKEGRGEGLSGQEERFTTLANPAVLAKIGTTITGLVLAQLRVLQDRMTALMAIMNALAGDYTLRDYQNERWQYMQREFSKLWQELDEMDKQMLALSELSGEQALLYMNFRRLRNTFEKVNNDMHQAMQKRVPQPSGPR